MNPFPLLDRRKPGAKTSEVVIQKDGIRAGHVHVQHGVRRRGARQRRDDARHGVDETLEASHGCFRCHRAMSTVSLELFGRRLQLERFGDLACIEIRITAGRALRPARNDVTLRLERHGVDDGDGVVVVRVAA